MKTGFSLLNTGLRLLTLLSVCGGRPLLAQTRFDFNNCLLPPGTSVNGMARIADDGTGANCVLHLTDTNQCNTNGVFVILDQAAGANLDHLHVRWRSRIGGDSGAVCGVTQFGRPGADGYSFNWGFDVGTADVGEEGTGTGLTVSVDTFDNGGGEAPGLEIKWMGARVAFDAINADPGLAKDFLRKNQFVEADLNVDSSGVATFTYDGRVLMAALPGWTGIAGGHFVFGGRTGGAADNHWIDDLRIGDEVVPTALSIGLNFGADEPLAPTLAPNAEAGAVPQANWNNLNGASGSVSSLVGDFSGSPVLTAASVTWSCPNTWSTTGRGEENNGFPAGPDRTLMTGYLDTDNGAGVATVFVSGLGPEFTACGYDVLVYCVGSLSGRGGAYRIGGTTKFGTTPASPATHSEDSGFDLTDTGTYVRFPGRTNSSFTLTADANPANGPNRNLRAPINGLQIVALGPSMGPRTNVLSPGDPIVIVNGVNDGDAFAGPPPVAEVVNHAIDGLTQKYLNFLDFGSGFIVTPVLGQSVVTGIRFYTANDAVERDPASYLLEGSNAGTNGPWTTMASGGLNLPLGRNPGGAIPINPAVHFNQTVAFPNLVPYRSYRVTFPTLKNAALANSMQIGEVELLGGAYVPGPAVFANTGSIVIPAPASTNMMGKASPYPSTISVSCLTGVVVRVTVTLTELAHTYLDDLDLLLVGPHGQRVLLMSDAGGGDTGISGRTLDFDDAASSLVPDEADPGSGRYRPSNYNGGDSDSFPAPAPAPPYGSALSIFNGVDPNGTWSLYILDDAAVDRGSLGGWKLNISTVPPDGGPVIVLQPQNQLVSPNSTVTFTVVAGPPPVTYQWRRNGFGIPGATNASYTITNVSPTDGGSYTVAVGHAGDKVLSNPATLIVDVPLVQGGDAFFGAVDLTFAPPVVRGNNIGATSEPGEPRHAGKLGGKSVWYTWQPNSNGIATIRARGSTFDTLLGVYSGSSVTNLIRVAGDEDTGGFYTSEVRFNGVAGTLYRIAVDGFAGAEGNYVLSREFEVTSQTLPVITSQPGSLGLQTGGNALFSVSGTGSGLSYQWSFLGTEIPGAIGSTLIISNPQPKDVGYYTVRVRNAVGRIVESLPAFLETRSGPGGLLCAGKYEDLFPAPNGGGGGAPAPLEVGIGAAQQSVTGGQSNITDTVTTTGTGPGSQAPCGIPANIMWHTLPIVPQDAVICIEAFGSLAKPRLVAASDLLVGTLHVPNPLPGACDTTDGPTNLPGRVAFPALANTQYYYEVDTPSADPRVQVFIRTNASLAIVRLPGLPAQVRLTWCVPTNSYLLEWTEHLRSPPLTIVWSSINSLPGGGNLRVDRFVHTADVLIESPPRFFRLRQRP